MWLRRGLEKLGYAPRVDLTDRADPAGLPEKMDEPASYDELQACLRDLARVNGVTGGYRPTLAFLDRVLAGRTATNGRIAAAPMEVLDIGFGYGDMLRTVRRWAHDRGVPVRLTGIELQPWAAQVAADADQRSGVPAGEIRWLAGDIFRYEGVRPDVVINSLVMHHLRDPEIVDMLRWMEGSARLGWFVNDLERAERPYRWYGVLAQIMRWHPYVRHDGPVSFRRAFRPDDWERLLQQAGVSGARVLRVAPARLCVERIRDGRS